MSEDHRPEREITFANGDIMSDEIIMQHELALGVEESIPMPAGAKVLSVYTVEGTPMVSYLTDPAQPIAFRYFQTVRAGQTRQKGGRFLGIVQTPSPSHGTLVLHVFDRGVLPARCTGQVFDGSPRRTLGGADA